MTKEEAQLMYAENTWGVYKYTPRSKQLIKELLKISTKYSETVCIEISSEQKDSDNLFDLSKLTVYLYYHERDIEIHEEIESNVFLSKMWCDTDCYDLEEERIKTLKTFSWAHEAFLEQLLEKNSEFEKLINSTNLVISSIRI